MVPVVKAEALRFLRAKLRFFPRGVAPQAVVTGPVGGRFERDRPVGRTVHRQLENIEPVIRPHHDERDAERRQDRDDRLVLDRPENAALDDEAEDADDERNRRQRKPEIPGLMDHVPREDCPEHEEVPVRNVDDLDQPEDKRETERDQDDNQPPDEPVETEFIPLLRLAGLGSLAARG